MTALALIAACCGLSIWKFGATVAAFSDAVAAADRARARWLA